MKQKTKVSLIAFMLLLSQQGYSAEQDNQDWETILAGVKDDVTGQQGYLYDTNQQRSGSLYNASVKYQFQGGNGDGDFESTEAVQMIITTLSGDTISTPGYLNPEQLSAWADEHADELLKAVFGTDPSATVSGTTTSVADASNTIIEQVATSKQQKRVKQNKKAQKAKAFDTSFSSLVIMDSEKANMKSNRNKGTSSAFRFTYDKELKSGNDVGTLFSYRSTRASDVYDSKSKSMLLSPYYEYYYTVNDDIEVIGVGNLLFNMRQMNSSLFNNFDYYEYGMGLSAIPSYYVNDDLSFSLPLGVQTIKKKINGNVPDTVDFIVDAINDLGFQSSFNYGLGAEYTIKQNWYVNLDILQTQEVGADKSYDKDKITYYNLRTTYYGELFNYALGYKTVKNIANYDEDAYMVSIQYNW